MNGTAVAESFRFLQQHRLKTGAEFDRVFRARRSSADEFLVVYVAPNDLRHPRLGLVVGRKVGGAVVRNRWRRLIREAFRLTQHQLPSGLDLVVLPRVAAPPPLLQLQGSLMRLAEKASRIRPRDAAGSAKSRDKK